MVRLLRWFVILMSTITMKFIKIRNKKNLKFIRETSFVWTFS